MTNAFELRTSLQSASRMVSMDGERQGASDRQIDMIVALARGANDFDVGCDRFLTSAGAARIISEMMARGIEPKWNKSEAELDAEDEAHTAADARAASRKRVKKQKEAEKAVRDAKKAEAFAEIAAIVFLGKTVRHKYFGEGRVIAEDRTTITVAFLDRNERIGKTVVEII